MSPYENSNFSPGAKNGSDRSFGLIVGGILLLIAVTRLFFQGMANPDWVTILLFALAFPLLGLALLAPHFLHGANKAWFGLGNLLGRIANPVVLGLIFVLTVIPTAFVMRLLGKRPLALERDPSANTYWIEKVPSGPAPETMKEQF